jgi:O-antigen/teichoic acid export membrane protein
MSKNKFTPAQKIAKESTIHFTGMIYGQVIRYIFIAILARTIGPKYLGIYSLGNSITQISQSIGNAGLDIGIMRFVSMHDSMDNSAEIKRYIKSALRMGFIFSMLIMITQIILAGWLTNSIFKETVLLKYILIAYAFSLPFYVFIAIAAAATRGYKLMKYSVFVINILNPTILLLTALISYLLISQEMVILLPVVVVGVIGFLVISNLLNKISGISYKGIVSGKFDNALLKFSIPLMFIAILGTMLHWMDIMMLGYFTDAKTVGLYHPAIRTAGLQQGILSSFIGIFAPMFTGYFSEENHEKMSDIYKLVTRWLLTIILPFAVVVIIFSKNVMLMFGDEFINVAPSLIILTIAMTIYSFLGASSTALTVTGFQRFNLINAILALILNGILNIILIPRYGIIGAAWATFSSAIVVTILRVVEFWIFTKLHPFSNKLFKSVLSGLIVGLILLLLKPFLSNFHAAIVMLIAFAIGLFSYSIILLILGFDEEDKDFLHSIKFLKNKVISRTVQK